MKFLLYGLILITGAIYLTFFFPNYRSAFEADQACHFMQWDLYKESLGYGCDHDIETNQWILFQKGEDHQISEVTNTFLY